MISTGLSLVLSQVGGPKSGPLCFSSPWNGSPEGRAGTALLTLRLEAPKPPTVLGLPLVHGWPFSPLHRRSFLGLCLICPPNLELPKARTCSVCKPLYP